MELDSLYLNYADYYRKKWFPSIYPDPFGPLADALNDETLKQLEKSLKAKPDRHAGALARALLMLMPIVQHASLVKEANRFLNSRIHGAPARFLLYYLRSLPAEEREQLQRDARKWAQESNTPLTEWLQVRTASERKHDAVIRAACASFGVEMDATYSGIEQALRATRELFDWELRRFGSGKDLADFLGIFRLQHADTLVDWNDFPALARNWSDILQFRNMPRLEPSPEDSAVQYTFPIDPPSRVRLHYGKAAGPVDAHRFLRELARAVSYTEMDPALPDQQRLLGDPSLPEFWAELYGTTLLQPSGFARLVRPGADELTRLLKPAIQLRIRHESVLALYRARVDSDLKEATDLYVALWENAFAFEAPHYLYLFDLERSENSLFTVLAYQAAIGAEERLRSLYGNEWFTSERCNARLRDYRRAGFTLRVADILADLEAKPATDFL